MTTEIDRRQFIAGAGTAGLVMLKFSQALPSVLSLAEQMAERASPPEVTHFGVVYGTATNVIRRFIEPDSNEELDRLVLWPGESLKKLPFDDHPVIRVAFIQEHIGPAAHSGRCARCDAEGRVVDIVQADPSVDPKLEGLTIIQHDRAKPGDLWSEGQFWRDFAVADVNGTVREIALLPVDGTAVYAGVIDEAVYPARGKTIGRPVPSHAIAIA